MHSRDGITSFALPGTSVIVLYDDVTHELGELVRPYLPQNVQGQPMTPFNNEQRAPIVSTNRWFFNKNKLPVESVMNYSISQRSRL